MNLTILEVDDPQNAIIRIAFAETGSSYSLVGTDNLQQPKNLWTLNLGWDVTPQGQPGTAEHEIGHALGLDHEHQHPTCPLQWDTEAVIKQYMQSQGWSRDDVLQQVINRVDQPYTGSAWNPLSIMHYPFSGNLITGPAPYNSQGIGYNSIVNDGDFGVVRQLYPTAAPSNTPAAPSNTLANKFPVAGKTLDVWQSIEPQLIVGQDQVFKLQPVRSGQYTIDVIGHADVLLVVDAVISNKEFHQIAASHFSHGIPSKKLSLSLLVTDSITYILKVRIVCSHKNGRFVLLLAEA